MSGAAARAEQKTPDKHFTIEGDLCTGCGLCEERAPDNLELASGDEVARVIRQPETPEEVEACTEAADYCPTGGLKPDDD
ncbi:MAG: ferredoxin [Deltaproteobacteria bacterium]|nr:ferredoxin [Deltaproteobacteria bacterium]MBW2396818.1 ferredoxin [Deltaproteobacteria bacterium]